MSLASKPFVDALLSDVGIVIGATYIATFVFVVLTAVLLISAAQRFLREVRNV